MNDEKRIIELQIPVTEGGKAVDLLAAASGLAKARLKDAMIKGAVRLKPAHSKGRRLRRATTEVRVGDELYLSYDEKILSAPVPEPVCLADHRSFSVWFKPVGLLSQGTDFGDFCSLLRRVELHFASQRKVLPIHRLDREVSGLVLVAHEAKAAARLSRCFANRLVTKSYLAGVRGRIVEDETLILDAPLDGKPALTRCRGLGYDVLGNQSLVLAQPETGRLHQIRRHLAGYGNAILGDPRYGNEGRGEMRLCAVRLVLAPEGKDRGLDLWLPDQYLPGWTGGLRLRDLV